MPHSQASSDDKATAPPLLAVLFDMDGVVTDTAAAHAAAWKEMFDDFLKRGPPQSGADTRPFDTVHDYLAYVDGKPRHDGIRSFLESRGIVLPEGDRDDSDDAATVYGLGRRKQRRFRAWLQTHSVDAYGGTLRLIRDLHTRGIKTGLFSSSRNARDVLASAAVTDLFEITVDGSDLADLHLPGKPDPSMLIEAASRLGFTPERVAIVEDALAGVEAGRRGHFALVVAVDRQKAGTNWHDAGADLVVSDPAELRVTTDRRMVIRTTGTLPLAWNRWEEIAARLATAPPVVIFKADGILTAEIPEATPAPLSRRPAHRGHGRRRVRVLPAIDQHKGDTVMSILEQLGIREPVMPIYIGHGPAEEEVFRMIAAKGLSFVVRDQTDRPTAADYALADGGEVDALIEAVFAEPSGSGA